MFDRYRSFTNYLKLLVPYWDKSLISLFCVAFTVLFSMASPLITKVLIDYAYPQKNLYLLSFLIIFGILLFFFETAFSYITSYLDTYIHQTLSIDLRKKFFTKILRLPMDYYHGKKVGDLLVRVGDDIDTIIDLIAEIVPVIIKTLFRLIALLAIALLIDRNLTLLALLGVPIYFVQTRFFAHKFEEIQTQAQKQSSEITSFYQEKMGNIKTIKSFNQEIYETGRLIDKLIRMFALVREGLIFGLFNSFVDNALVVIWTSFLGWYAGYQVISGNMSIGEIMAILMYLGQVHQPFMDFGSIYKSAVRSSVSINRVNEILETPPEVYQDSQTYVLYQIDGQIRFENVSFQYADSGEAILHQINLTASPGKITAIFGASGEGKSTILDLVLRFIHPTEGKIYIDKYDLKEVSLMTLRAYISIVSQDVIIFSGTVRENLIYGCVSPSEEKMVQAARDAEIHDFILDLPQGYETQIGESGHQLSGGQLQRLSIARALLRDVRILVFDEATSALDVIAEAKIFENIKKHLKDKTMILISHRPSTLTHADQIYVLADNHIVEEGSFDQLLEKKGEFYKFYQTALHKKEEAGK